MRRIVWWVQHETGWVARDKWGDTVASKREAEELWRRRVEEMLDMRDPDVRRRLRSSGLREEMRAWLSRRRLVKLVEVRGRHG